MASNFLAFSWRGALHVLHDHIVTTFPFIHALNLLTISARIITLSSLQRFSLFIDNNNLPSCTHLLSESGCRNDHIRMIYGKFDKKKKMCELGCYIFPYTGRIPKGLLTYVIYNFVFITWIYLFYFFYFDKYLSLQYRVILPRVILVLEAFIITNLFSDHHFHFDELGMEINELRNVKRYSEPWRRTLFRNFHFKPI